jgi:hypothetical protein
MLDRLQVNSPRSQLGYRERSKSSVRPTFSPDDPVQDDVLGLQLAPDATPTEVVEDRDDKAGSASPGDEDGDVMTREVCTGSVWSIEQDGRGSGFKRGETGTDPTLDIGLEDDDHLAFVRL